MNSFKALTLRVAAVGTLAFAIAAPQSASAALVSGTATITIDNTAFSTSSINVGGGYPAGWVVDQHWGPAYNDYGINASTPNGTAISHTGSTAMSFPVNTNTTTIVCVPGPAPADCGTYGRTLQATDMDASNTSAAGKQIGLSGAWLLTSPGGSGVLTPYDFSLTKTAGTWNIRSYDNAFGYQNFLKLTSVSESVDINGNLLLSGDLKWTGLWASLVGANTNTVVGHINLGPAPVPVPAAVWLFCSALAGLVGIGRRKAAISA